MPLIEKILIANRGEIALRVMRTCRRLGIATVAIYSEADLHAEFVREADEAIAIGGAPSRESYLKQAAIVEAAQRSGAQAIHPGYGFLSENASFAAACEAAGLIFLGPAPATIEQMGSKSAAKRLMQAHGVPVVPGYEGEEQSLEIFQQAAEACGYPVLLKAVAGGGGKGMRVVRNSSELPEALAAAQREALNAFGDSRLLLEKFFESVRHIEMQILGDAHGKLIHLGERECTIQRRHQKIIEETPSPALTHALRQALAVAALQAGRAIQYRGAGTVEFIVTPEQQFYFLEVNTRLQVEHPITEAVTGVDLVEWQIRIGEGEPLALEQNDLNFQGHALECRLYAEDPDRDFFPVTGSVLQWLPAELPNVRFDSGISQGTEISIHYDPLLAKMIVHRATRAEALRVMRQAIQQTIVLGVTTNQKFLHQILSHPEFIQGVFNTAFIARHWPEALRSPAWKPDEQNELLCIATLWAWLQRQQQRRAWISIPSGWRNNPYSLPSTEWHWAGRSWQVSYEVLSSESWRFTLGEATLQAQLLACTQGKLEVAINGVRRSYYLAMDSTTLWIQRQGWAAQSLQLIEPWGQSSQASLLGDYRAPMPGKVIQVLAREGQMVSLGQPLLILESMKMETTVTARQEGVIQEICVQDGQVIKNNEVLLVIGEATLPSEESA